MQKAHTATQIGYVNLQQTPHLDICVPRSQIYLPSVDFTSTLCHGINETHFTTECNCREIGYLKSSTAYLQKIRC